VVLILVAVVFSLAAGRAVQVQAVEADATAAQAVKAMTVTHTLQASRGTITDRDGEVLAYSSATVNIVADPQMIMTNGKSKDLMTAADEKTAAAAPKQIAALLARYVGGTAATYLPALTKAGSQYSIVARQVSPDIYTSVSSAMRKAGLIGLYDENAPSRVYPGGTLAANVIGFVNNEGTGSGGLEYALNSTLSGTDGSYVYQGSPNGPVPLAGSTTTPAVNGSDYQLTIDAGLQSQVEQIVANQVKATGSTWGIGLVMNINTGELLSLANYPTFNPNAITSADSANLGNKAVAAPYTPGSVEKTLTFAAMLDTGTITPLTVVRVPDAIKSGNGVVHDDWTHAAQPLYAQGIYAESSNVGTIELARKMSATTLRDYLVSFGLGSPTGVGLPGESAGVLPPADMPAYTHDQIAFGGSGLSVTAVQEAAAVASVTNGGIYHQPTIVKSVTSPDGTVTQLKPTVPSRRVVSAKTSKQVDELMETMTVNAAASTFSVPGYRVGTKTGTSQIWNTSCGCFKGTTASVIGIAPVENPQILVYVIMNDPRGGVLGAVAAAPAWKQVMAIAASRYGVPPSTTKPPALPVKP